jgi:hypothetical protein
VVIREHACFRENDTGIRTGHFLGNFTRIVRRNIYNRRNISHRF